MIVAAAAVEQEVAVELGARARRHARARRACVLKRDGYGPPSGTLGSGSREASAARPASSGTPSVWWRERRRCEDGGGRGGAGRFGGLERQLLQREQAWGQERRVLQQQLLHKMEAERALLQRLRDWQLETVCITVGHQGS